ncbi:MAG: AAA family ATPase [Verrucomicrobium sp.]|nr:AAA family ATPase [Verrucomicrobium sp.]
MLKTLHVRGYRSLLDFRLKLGRVTVVTGENGSGKSNLYRSLAMLQRLAEGRFAEAIAAEGGMPSLVWSGPRLRNEPIRVSWSLEHDFFKYELECGLIPATPGDPTAFRTDPDVKREQLALHQGGKGHIVARRKGPMVELRSFDKGFEPTHLSLHAPESMLAESRDAARFPGPTAAREILLSWRFYHQFRTDPESSLRRPRIGSWSPVLAHDGSNLAATLRTLQENGRGHLIDEAVARVFPDISWRAVDDQGRFQLQILRPTLKRWLDASELSDGTLRYFCLCAALLTPKPPPLLVLNEPETSLHEALMPGLAELIAQVPEETQILVVTHSQLLASEIESRLTCRRLDLLSHGGETRRTSDGEAKRVWVIEDNEDEGE